MCSYVHVLYIGALNCIIKKRLYKGKLSILPCDSAEQTTNQTSEGSFQTYHPNQPDEPDLPDQPEQPQQEEVVSNSSTKSKQLKEDVGNGGDVTMTTTEQTGTQEINTETSVSTQPETKIEASEPSNHESETPRGNMEVIHQFGPKADLLPPLSGPVPDNWETIEREFMSVTTLMIPHVAHNFYGDPEVSIGGGKFRLVICDGQITRVGMFGFLTKADTGQHVKMEGVMRKDAIAFRLEPHTTPGMLTIDGEVVYYGPLQCQIHPGLARVMCRKRQV